MSHSMDVQLDDKLFDGMDEDQTEIDFEEDVEFDVGEAAQAAINAVTPNTLTLQDKQDLLEDCLPTLLEGFKRYGSELIYRVLDMEQQRVVYESPHTYQISPTDPMQLQRIHTRMRDGTPQPLTNTRSCPFGCLDPMDVEVVQSSGERITISLAPIQILLLTAWWSPSNPNAWPALVRHLDKNDVSIPFDVHELKEGSEMSEDDRPAVYVITSPTGRFDVGWSILPSKRSNGYQAAHLAPSFRVNREMREHPPPTGWRRELLFVFPPCIRASLMKMGFALESRAIGSTGAIKSLNSRIHDATHIMKYSAVEEINGLWIYLYNRYTYIDENGDRQSTFVIPAESSTFWSLPEVVEVSKGISPPMRYEIMFGRKFRWITEALPQFPLECYYDSQLPIGLSPYEEKKAARQKYLHDKAEWKDSSIPPPPKRIRTTPVPTTVDRLLNRPTAANRARQNSNIGGVMQRSASRFG